MIRDPKTKKWINTSRFKPAANYFNQNGYYTNEAWGSPEWYNFWEQERERCLNGYEVDGEKITGEHYFYLNYCPIKLSKKTGKKTSIKTTDFPDFWDGDYDYFWIREIARNGVLKNNHHYTEEEKERIYNLEPLEREKELVKALDKLGLRFKIPPSYTKGGIRIENLLGGKHVVVIKSRRKGFSYKNASVSVLNFYHRPSSYTMLMAYDKKYLYPKGIFTMCMNYINFINEHTAWRTPADYIRKQDHIRNSYKQTVNGVELEKGYMSEIQAISFKDNPQAGVGKDCYDILGEEVGAWGKPGGLKETVAAMLPSVQDGENTTGMITLFGTSNDIEKGTVDIADIFNNPYLNDFLPFIDIWSQNNVEKVEGFFFPAQLNLVGYYDENGNSDIDNATKYIQDKRKKLEHNGATSTKILQEVREFPLNSTEALNSISFNNFPVIELKEQLNKVKNLELQFKKGTPCELIRDSSNNVVVKPILDNSIEPIISYKSVPTNTYSCPIIYEMPVNNPPAGLYKIGYDIVNQDDGTSLAAIIVFKGNHTLTTRKNIIVAEYVGRRNTPEDVDKIAESFADLYGTQIMHENMSNGTINYFRRIKRTNLLARQPDAVISKAIKNSKVSRIYGCHLNGNLKNDGIRYIKEWLTEVQNYDENGKPITTISDIYSIRLLEELIYFDSKGNFDLISALIMCMFQVQEEELGKEYSEKKPQSRNAKDLLAMLNQNIQTL